MTVMDNEKNTESKIISPDVVKALAIALPTSALKSPE